jgi:hypothetical protein
MLARSGPLDEKSSPLMVVAQARCNIAKSQEPQEGKSKVTVSAEFRIHHSGANPTEDGPS